MLKAAHHIVCVNLGIAWRVLPSTALLLPGLAPAPSLSRWRSSVASQAELQEAMDKINDLFVEAREEIAYAQEDAETTYFNDSYDDAKALVGTVLDEWSSLLGKLEDEERGKVQRSMGLKMEQLKAELGELDKLHD